MKFYVDNEIEIYRPTVEAVLWCKQNLIIDNPDYQKKKRMGKWLGDTPREIFLFRKKGDTLVVPFGCLDALWRTFAREHEFYPDFSSLIPFTYYRKDAIELYPYQEEAVSLALKQKNGVLVMPCGSGKTLCGLEIIARVGGRALWLTHTHDLLNQSRTRARSVFNGSLGSGEGTITGGKIDVGKGITFATVQTLSKIDLSEFKHFWSIIIVDECHHCAGSPTRVTQFYKVMSALSARYKIGLTATPYRADGLQQSMFALLGGIIHSVTKEDVAETTCPIKVMEIETGYTPDYDAVLAGDGTIDYAALSNNLICDKARFDKVLETLKDLRGKPTIVLANRVQYLLRLRDRLGWSAVCLSGGGQGAAAKAQRKRALADLNDGKINYILATYQLAKEGLDVPNLQYLVLATPEKDPITITQSVGRVGRAAEGKPFGMVIDFVDDFAMYRRWSKKRRSIYKKIDAEII